MPFGNVETIRGERPRAVTSVRASPTAAAGTAEKQGLDGELPRTRQRWAPSERRTPISRCERGRAQQRFVTFAQATRSTSENADPRSPSRVTVSAFTAKRLPPNSTRAAVALSSGPAVNRWRSHTSNQARACVSVAPSRRRPTTTSDGAFRSVPGNAPAIVRGAQKDSQFTRGRTQAGRRRLTIETLGVPSVTPTTMPVGASGARHVASESTTTGALQSRRVREDPSADAGRTPST